MEPEQTIFNDFPLTEIELKRLLHGTQRSTLIWSRTASDRRSLKQKISANIYTFTRPFIQVNLVEKLQEFSFYLELTKWC